MFRAGLGTWAVLLGTLCGGASAQDEVPLKILPETIELVGPEARQQLLAEATLGGHQEDWTDLVEWSSLNPEVARVDGSGLVRPVSDGSAVITAKADIPWATVSATCTL